MSKMQKKNSKIIKKTKPIEAKPEHYFVLVTGAPLKNLKELALALETMNDWVFYHHVNNERNDFANWIRDILKEDILADELKEIKHIKEMETKILKHLVTKYL